MIQAFDNWLLEDIKEKPSDFHWTQSPLEKVIDAEVLIAPRNVTLVRTNFLAPKLLVSSPFTTAEVGESNRYLYEIAQNIKSFRRNLSLFFKYCLPENYEAGEFMHIDYTLWCISDEIRAFANMRIYPEGSYFLDLIEVEVDVKNHGGTGVSSKSPFLMDDDLHSMPIENRSKPLSQLALSNRAETIVLIEDEKEYIGENNAESIVLKNDESDKILFPSDIGQDVLRKCNSAYICDEHLMRTTRYFTSLLEILGIDHRT